MKKTLIKKLEKLLNDRRTEIIAKSARELDIDIDGDETDEIQGKAIANVLGQITARNKEQVARIDKALTKIKDGTFGTCEECSEKIGEKRLEFNPEFHNCFECADQNEQEAKQRRLRG
jgi:DnaK suppressor protein